MGSVLYNSFSLAIYGTSCFVESCPHNDRHISYWVLVGCWRRVVLWMYINVSEEHTASTYVVSAESLRTLTWVSSNVFVGSSQVRACGLWGCVRTMRLSCCHGYLARARLSHHKLLCNWQLPSALTVDSRSCLPFLISHTTISGVLYDNSLGINISFRAFRT
jgi:hypothetical protein